MPDSEKASSEFRESDPLLRDLAEKRKSFKQNVKNLVAELKDVRSQMTIQRESLVRETQYRKAAEMNARRLQEENCQLQKSFAERNKKLQASVLITEQYLRELDNLTSQLSLTQVTSDASTVSTQCVQPQCLDLLRNSVDESGSLEEYRDKINRLGEKLDQSQRDSQTKKASEKHLKDEVLRNEHVILYECNNAGASLAFDLGKVMEQVCKQNFEKINKHLIAVDEQIARLENEIKDMSTHLKPRINELESQLEKHQRLEQELKKQVLKLEFCLQEASFQIWHLQKMGENREKSLKELRHQLTDEQQCDGRGLYKQNFWEYPSFKIAISMSILVLVVYTRC